MPAFAGSAEGRAAAPATGCCCPTRPEAKPRVVLLLLYALDDDPVHAALGDLLSLHGDRLRCTLHRRRIALRVLVVLEEQEHLAVLREDPHRQALLRAGLGALLVTGALAGFRVVQVVGEVDDLPRDAVIGPDLQYASR